MAISALSSCSTSDKTDGSSVAPAADITELDVSVSLMSAAKSYDIVLAGDSMHLVMSASVQWPQKIGNHDLSAFQDSIITFAFPQEKSRDIKNAIAGYVNDVESTGLIETGAVVTICKEAYPDNVNNYSCDIDARVLEFSDKMITYQIVESTYLGGAHPNTTSRALTYDFVNSTLLTLSNVIKPESIPAFTQIVKRNMLQQLDMSEAEFAEQTLAPTFTVGSDLFIGDGSIYVHYNTYEILPHSYGSIDVMVSPYEVRDMLTPIAQSLLIED
ncbi:MAG: DUF3298 and DUF4163 domain-containing protein [Muribaculaceae bacterium]|nr:DUF3298 and DUF4163 domain-containing protein [Muribaculaceae bacterium]